MAREEIGPGVFIETEEPGRGTARGATVEPEYVERRLRIFGITEVEMDDLTLMNTGVTAASALATLFVGLAIPTAVSILLASPTRVEAVALWGLVAVLLVLAVCSAIAIVPMHRRRKTTRETVKRESKSVDLSRRDPSQLTE
jgi:hypothetical protein